MTPWRVGRSATAVTASSGHEARPRAGLQFGTFLAPSLLPLYQAVAGAVGRAIGVPTELVVETSYENCVADVNDLCFVCSLPDVMFERERIAPAAPLAAPILVGARYRNRPIYYSDVIVRRDSGLRSFLDLRGRSWAYNEPLSQSGYGITRHHLVTLGETSGFFSRVVEAGFHEESIRMVADGRVDGAAIDSHVLAVERRNHPGLAEVLRVVDVLGPSTIQPVAVSKRIPMRMRARILQVLLNLHRDTTMRRHLDDALVVRFVPVASESFDDIRAMVDACEAAGFMELR